MQTWTWVAIDIEMLHLFEKMVFKDDRSLCIPKIDVRKVQQLRGFQTYKTATRSSTVYSPFGGTMTYLLIESCSEMSLRYFQISINFKIDKFTNNMQGISYWFSKNGAILFYANVYLITMTIPNTKGRAMTMERSSSNFSHPHPWQVLMKMVQNIVQKCGLGNNRGKNR